MARPLHEYETGYGSSIAPRRGLRLRPELSGEAGRRGVWPIVTNFPLESTPGDECALCMRGVVKLLETCDLAMSVDGDWFLDRTGSWYMLRFVVGMLESLSGLLTLTGL